LRDRGDLRGDLRVREGSRGSVSEWQDVRDLLTPFRCVNRPRFTNGTTGTAPNRCSSRSSSTHRVPCDEPVNHTVASGRYSVADTGDCPDTGTVATVDTPPTTRAADVTSRVRGSRSAIISSGDSTAINGAPASASLLPTVAYDRPNTSASRCANCASSSRSFACQIRHKSASSSGDVANRNPVRSSRSSIASAAIRGQFTTVTNRRRSGGTAIPSVSSRCMPS
jgi:hypothetical protein